MSSAAVRVALVIPVHNRREVTLQCLRSLERIDSQGLDVKIFVVDDGSTDGTSVAIRSRFPEVDIIAGDGTLHYAAGTNRGIEAAIKWPANFVVMMNDDSVFHDQFLQRLVATAMANPRSLVGALLLLWNEPHRVFQVAPKWRPLRGGWSMPEDLTAFSVESTSFGVDVIVGNCVLVPAEAIKECGMLDERRFPHGWGDAQYTTRLRRAGWKLLIEPRAFVWCEPNEYPPSLHQMTLPRMFEVLFRDRTHPQNLQRQFIALWESAPSKVQAITAFIGYLLGLVVKSFTFGFRRLTGRNIASDHVRQ